MRFTEVNSSAIAVTDTPEELLMELEYELRSIEDALNSMDRAYRVTGVDWSEKFREEFMKSLQKLVENVGLDVAIQAKYVTSNELDHKKLTRKICLIMNGHEYA